MSPVLRKLNGRNLCLKPEPACRGILPEGELTIARDLLIKPDLLLNDRIDP
jgi:hypothetical protein